MTDWPENDPHNQSNASPGWPPEPGDTEPPDNQSNAAPSISSEPAHSATQELGLIPNGDAGLQEQRSHSEIESLSPLLFRNYEVPRQPERIPNFGHLGTLVVLLAFALLLTGLLTQLALAHHFWGVTSRARAIADIHYTLGTEALLYLFTLAQCLIVFPLIWHKNFFAGIQWNGAVAYRLRWRLVSAAVTCLVLALFSSLLVPGPSNTPIDKIFHIPGAPWLLFGFGVTFAPFFEETFFRGFLLPALCTAIDWIREVVWHEPRLPLGAHDHPQWSLTAMVVAAVATSLPFALLHAQQTGWSFGPFILLVGISIVLCAVRLYTRSLASSVLVHATYNFMLFSIMVIGTQGFRHLGKL